MLIYCNKKFKNKKTTIVYLMEAYENILAFF